ncbi:MAG: protein-ADP-ribose hydrolase [Peptococcaceae bacterium]|nr:protein-ADP-ribose hydrolase [Peptococcaceae bacterium]
MTQDERRVFLIDYLLHEEEEYRDMAVPADAASQKRLLRALMNVRPAAAASEEFLRVQDDYLQARLAALGVTDIDDLAPVQDGLYIWQGDITTLRCDAIVNAANSGMTGCYQPNHGCIDNAIHTYAGIQLRQACAALMACQNAPEPTGRAKITPAYNLPSRYVLHTVGPIIYGGLRDTDCQLLASCYRSCLALAATYHLESVAFCCISTGEFHFPNQRAAEIAIHTVRDFLKTPSTVKKIIFNVFKDEDKFIYEDLLS